MDYSDILYDIDGGAAIITLNRPEKLNAWTSAMDRDVRDALARADRDRAVRGVILTGAGRGFCAGADMSTLNSIASAGGEEVTVNPLERTAGLEANYHQRFSFPLATQKPLIAAVNGAAAGLGLILSLYCDIRFASENARFGTAFAKIGLIAEHGVSWLLPRAVGSANAFDMLYSARMVGAEEALKIGLVQRVFPADGLLASAKAYIEALRDSSPEAMRVMKRLVWDANFTPDLATAVQNANAAMPATLASADFKEGLAAFGEKRSPQFRGVGGDDEISPTVAL